MLLGVREFGPVRTCRGCGPWSCGTYRVAAATLHPRHVCRVVRVAWNAKNPKKYAKNPGEEEK